MKSEPYKCCVQLVDIEHVKQEGHSQQWISLRQFGVLEKLDDPSGYHFGTIETQGIVSGRIALGKPVPVLVSNRTEHSVESIRHTYSYTVVKLS